MTLLEVVPTPSEQGEGCPRCHGRGWVMPRLDNPNDPRFGRAEMCACRQAQVRRDTVQRLMGQAGLGRAALRTFASFRLTGDSDPHGPDAAYYLCRKYAEGKISRPWLFLYGAFGSGKTHLALAIANERIAALVPVLFSAAPDLIDTIRSGYNDGTYQALMEQTKNVELLALDDFGIGKQGAETNEYRLLFQILNHRSLQMLPTVITSNIAPEGIEPRLRSRIMDNALTTRVKIQSDDTRRYS